MDNKIKVTTFINNVIPEFGYLTDERIEYLPITHRFAKRAAERLLDYENCEYLPGYLQVVYNNEEILSVLHPTGDLLETWSDLAYILETGAMEDEYKIVLLDYITNVSLLKKESGFCFKVEKFKDMDETICFESATIPKKELLNELYLKLKEFINFCTKSNLTFGRDSSLNSLQASYATIEKRME